MTPVPIVGDIWEWFNRIVYTLVEERESSTVDSLNFKALNLTSGGMEIISINNTNIHRWERLA